MYKNICYFFYIFLVEKSTESDARQPARKASDAVLNEFDEARQRAWTRDQQTLEYIDEILVSMKNPRFNYSPITFYQKIFLNF